MTSTNGSSNGITLDDLAGMVKKGFDDLGDKMEKGFDAVDKRFEKVEKRLGALEEGQEAIQLRLGNVPYRFEFTELQKRIEVLEKR